MANAQFTLRGPVAHVQVGSMGGYSKFDVPATPELIDFYNDALDNGKTGRSFADTSTQYAPVTVVEKTVRRIVAHIPAREIVLSEEA